MNCKPLQEYEYKRPNNDKFTLLYLGSLSRSRFLIELAETVVAACDPRSKEGWSALPGDEAGRTERGGNPIFPQSRLAGGRTASPGPARLSRWKNSSCRNG